MAATARGNIERSAIDYRVQVPYTVPIEVLVNLDTSAVDRVAVLTGMPVLDRGEAARRESWLNPVPEAIAARAVEIAERTAPREWPAWELVL